MKQINSSQQILIDSLSEFYNVVMIIDPSKVLTPEVYIVVDYRTATESNPFFSIKGYKVATSILDANSAYFNSSNSLETIKTQIDSLQSINRERKFSNHFQWIKF